MRRGEATNLLDVPDELLQLPREVRASRVAQLELSDQDRTKLTSWLESNDSSDGFLESPPPLAREAMQLLASSPDDSGDALGEGRDEGGVKRNDLEAAVPPQVPGYQCEGLLGQVGMASVWRARQIGTGQHVALKVMNPLLFTSARARGRFERELRLTSTLRHPSIARIYDGGTTGGACYYAMELVEGEHLDRYVSERKLSQRQVLELMRQVCEAVQHAHQNGIIHRDLKPSNILVDSGGGPRVLDFGLAKALADAGPELTISLDGDLAGTPAYMSPEQAAGAPTVDTRSDVYSLGVILYRLLTGNPPHELSGSRLEVLKRIRLCLKTVVANNGGSSPTVASRESSPPASRTACRCGGTP